MDWHYSENGQQFGPVTEEQLQRLATSGVVRPDMLVWHAGMTDWKPYREVGPGLPPPIPGQNGATRLCTSCRRAFAAGDLATFGDSLICLDCKPGWVQRLRQGMTSTSGSTLVYAGFWVRLGAYLIDSLILSVVFGALFAFFFGGAYVNLIRQAAEAGRTGQPADPSSLAPAMAGMGFFNLFYLVCHCAYCAFFWVRYGATPGKMALGLRVVTPSGGPISWGQGIGRYFGTILSTVILWIGFMMIGWDEQKRALHDRLAGTRVITTR